MTKDTRVILVLTHGEALVVYSLLDTKADASGMITLRELARRVLAAIHRQGTR